VLTAYSLPNWRLH